MPMIRFNQVIRSAPTPRAIIGIQLNWGGRRSLGVLILSAEPQPQPQPASRSASAVVTPLRFSCGAEYGEIEYGRLPVKSPKDAAKRSPSW